MGTNVHLMLGKWRKRVGKRGIKGKKKLLENDTFSNFWGFNCIEIKANALGYWIHFHQKILSFDVDLLRREGVVQNGI